jgi:uncharacterized protein (DUF362 family)
MAAKERMRGLFMSAGNAERNQLLAYVAADGGWGFTTGQTSHPEPTALVLLVLSADAVTFAEPIRRGLAALASHRTPDGAYRLERGRPQAFWPTALALHALTITAAEPQTTQATAQSLLNVQGKSIPNDPEFAGLMDIDTERIGWPWALNTFSWVEPTSYAIIALRAAGHGNHPRVAEGIRTLLDRAFETGGANYGNRTVLGQLTTPFPTPTALMLLALQGLDTEPRIQAALNFLDETLQDSNDLEHLGWGILALLAHGKEASPHINKLADIYASQCADKRPISVHRRCVALLGLDAASRNPFRLDGAKRTPPDMSAQKPENVASQLPDQAGLFGKLKAKFRGVVINGLSALKALPPCDAVSVARAKSYEEDLLTILREQFEHFRPHVPLAGKRVVLKPNLVEYHAERPINTDPRFIDAVIRLCQAEGAREIIVAEGPGHWRNVDYLLDVSGLGEVLRKHGIRFVDINHDEPVKVPNMGRLTGLEYLFFTRTIVDAEVLISLPKLKMHHWAGVTLSLKNLFGILPGQCYGWPKNELHWRGIPQSVVDIALTQTPHLAIVDGVVGMEGDGPIYGQGRHMGALVMGQDLLAVDATCARMIGMPPERVPVCVLAAMKKLGRLDTKTIRQVGVDPETLKADWVWPPQIEKLLMPATKAG